MKNTLSFQNRPSLILIILFLLFAIPLGLAWFLIDKNPLLNLGTTQHGQLIQPPLNFKQLNLEDANAQRVNADAWKGYWLLLYVTPQACQSACEKQLYYLQQIRSMTGKDSNRIKRAIISLSSPTDTHLQHLLSTKFVGTLFLKTNKQQFVNFVSQNKAAKLALPHASIYLVDPLGNMLMEYRESTQPMDIYKDLSHLLKISSIG